MTFSRHRSSIVVERYYKWDKELEYMSRVIIHADDYAISTHVSESIVSQIEQGAIQSISVMPNLESTEAGILMLKPFADKVLVSIHLNLVEGRCVADPKTIPLIAGRSGYFKLSWLQIMMKSVSREFRRQAGIEFRAQVVRTRRLLAEAGFTGRLRIDSHQHIHMIPGLFGVVCGLTREFNIEYIRLTREPLVPFFRARELWKTYSVVNLAKNLLLNLFAVPDGNLLRRLDLEYHYFFGLLLTGRMDYPRVTRLIPLMPDHHALEVVLHAGRMLESEVTAEYNKKDFVKEHVSSNRLLELETVERLNKR